MTNRKSNGDDVVQEIKKHGDDGRWRLLGLLSLRDAAFLCGIVITAVIGYSKLQEQVASDATKIEVLRTEQNKRIDKLEDDRRLDHDAINRTDITTARIEAKMDGFTGRVDKQMDGMRDLIRLMDERQRQ